MNCMYAKHMEGDIQKLQESTIQHRFFEFTFPHRFGWIGFAIAMLLFLSSIILFIFSLSIPDVIQTEDAQVIDCLLYTSPSPRDRTRSRMPSSA